MLLKSPCFLCETQKCATQRHLVQWQIRQHCCVGPSPPRSRCQEAIKCTRVLLGEMPLRKKWGEIQRRLGEPSDCNISLALSEGDREGGLVGVSETTQQSKKSLARSSESPKLDADESMLFKNGPTWACLPSSVTGWGQLWEARLRANVVMDYRV